MNGSNNARVVYKFGGTSVADADCIKRVAELILAGPGERVVVVSAMSGITNMLVDATRTCEPLPPDLAKRHIEVLQAIGVQPDDPLFTEILESIREVDVLLASARALGGVTPRTRDRILAVGEKLSARLLAAQLNASRPESALAMNADEFLDTNACFGDATPRHGVVESSIRAAIAPVLSRGVIAIVTGFCGRTAAGETTTLGRGGSDYSATLIAAAVDADEVVIWTDVPGVYSANPKLVTDARIIPHLNYQEAGELSYYGANVLHPSTIQPLIDQGIPIHVRSTFQPQAAGTRITAAANPGSHQVKAVSAVLDQALISVEGTGMAGVPGIASRLFTALAEEDISVTMISQSNAESSVCLAVPDDRVTDAEVALRRAFRLDLAQGRVDDIRMLGDVALVAAVGLGMQHTHGVASRFFGALADAGVNVIAIAQGSSELNITCAVNRSAVSRALNSIHRTFGLHRLDPGHDDAARSDLLLLGWGRIGRALASLVQEQASVMKDRFGITPRIVGIADQTGYLLNPLGITDDVLRSAAKAKEFSQPVASLPDGVTAADSSEFINEAFRYRLVRPVVVDVSGCESTELLRTALNHGADIVAANKVPFAGFDQKHHSFFEQIRSTVRIVRLETTVGAGLPIVDTIEHLVASGDRLYLMTGCFSGTLTYLLSEMESGRSFDDVLCEAAKRGYVEPNPMHDLSGEDVLRKAIILSRVAGFDIPLEKIRGCGVVAADPNDPSRPDRKSVEQLETQVRQAAAKGQALRYVATIDHNRIEIGLQSVELSSPIGMLKGTDNLIQLHSERYQPEPLVVAGPGAGVAVTAMGVLADISRVIAERS